MNKLENALNIILNTDSDFDACHQAVASVAQCYRDFLGPLSCDVNQAGTQTETGIALNPDGAIECLLDVWRTVKYLRAVERAFRTLKDRSELGTLRIVDAGCGPLAALILPLATRWDLTDTEIYLLDIHPQSLQMVESVIEGFSLPREHFQLLCGDAATVQVADGEPIHLLVSETMTAALNQEGQAGITCHLTQQLHEHGRLIPQQITLSVVLTDPADEFAGEGLGCDSAGLQAKLDKRCFSAEVFHLNADSWRTAVGEDEQSYLLPGAVVTVPQAVEPAQQVFITTRIQLLDDIVLEEYESGLTVPMYYGGYDAADSGRALQFSYLVSQQPGLQHKPVD